MELFGRREIYTDEDTVTPFNVIDILQKSFPEHAKNRSEIKYLYEYYKGNQPILHKQNEVRPEINNIVVENRANEIVSFKTGYLLGEPIQYVNRSGDDETGNKLNKLNEFIFAEDKASSDKQLSDWMHICGVGYRVVLPDIKGEEDESPFEMYVLNPMDTFIVKSSGLGHKPLMSVMYFRRNDRSTIYYIYTDEYYFEIENRTTFLEISENPLGAIPVIEYKANTAMLGAFEIVVKLLDAINIASSDRLDGIEQFVQALLVLKSAEIDDDKFKKIKELGGIQIPESSDIKYLVQELNQTQTQVYVDYMYDAVLTICGMPNRNGGTSTSDTGRAVIYRDGWSSAESRAKDTELMFKESEKEFLKIVLLIVNQCYDLDLKLSDIEIRFTRRNYDNTLEKSQVLTTMLGNDMIDPKLAFDQCGLFVDSNNAYLMSMAYYTENQKREMTELDRYSQNEAQVQKDSVGVLDD